MNNKEIKENEEEDLDKYIEEIKKKKNVKMFDQQELKIIKHFNENEVVDDNFLKKEFKKGIIKKEPIEGTGKNRVENNVILIRPQIFPSNKQVQYDNHTKFDRENYLYQLIKIVNNKKNGGLAIKDILEKITKYENFINDLHLQKLKEKLNLTKNNNNIQDKEKMTIHELENLSSHSGSLSETSDDSFRRHRYRKLTIYDKIWNCCCRSPLKPYSLKKRIWAGEEGVFKKQFQDNRDYY